jgi:lipoyl synthase
MDVVKNELRLPEWLKRPPGSVSQARELKKLLRKSKLNTVCEEARCPNISECFSNGTATFMILGDVCTRGCRFCSVTTGKPRMSPLDFEDEADRVADAAIALNLSYVVITSVARDDLADGGADGFVATIRMLRKRVPGVTIEILIPDLRGNHEALSKILDARPDVLNHNLETVPRLYRRVRPGASYVRSLELLRHSKVRYPGILTKTGIMLGLGETPDEVEKLILDAREYLVDIFTAGQYMRPGKEYLPVERYLSPEEFTEYRNIAVAAGFRDVFIDPLVRSSYHAGEKGSRLVHTASADNTNVSHLQT